MDLSLVFWTSVLAVGSCSLIWLGFGAIRLEAFLSRRDPRSIQRQPPHDR
jgi:hypothetical protein